jgi:hypothetical protein
MPHANLEHLASILRVFPDGSSYGDPFSWSATLRWIAPDTVEVCGAMRAPTPSEWRAIRECLVSLGVTTAVITRHKAGHDYSRRIKLE